MFSTTSSQSETKRLRENGVKRSILPGSSGLLRQGRSMSIRQPRTQFNCSRLIVLRGIDAAEAGVIGVGVGSTEARVVEGVERVETNLQADLFGGAEVFRKTDIQVIHSAATHVAPACWIRADVSGEILVYTV